MNKINVAVITSLIMLGLLTNISSGIYYSSDGLWKSPDGYQILFNETTNNPSGKYLDLGNTTDISNNTLFTVYGKSSFYNDIKINEDIHLRFKKNNSLYFNSWTDIFNIVSNKKIAILSEDSLTLTSTSSDIFLNSDVQVFYNVTAKKFIGGGITPIGGIIIWYGNYTEFNAMNNGDYGLWAICNGTIQNGMYTPDLQDIFVRGASVSSDNINDTGGNALSSLSVANLPAHNHLLPTNIVTGVTTTPISVTTGFSSAISRVTVTTNSSSRSQGSGSLFSNEPPYRCLYYIMRVG